MSTSISTCGVSGTQMAMPEMAPRFAFPAQTDAQTAAQTAAHAAALAVALTVARTIAWTVALNESALNAERTAA